MTAIHPPTLDKIRDLNSLLAFLRNTDPSNGLGWMIRDDVEPEELFYDYSEGNFAKVGEGLKLRQLINMTSAQPWGVFLVETSTQKLYTTEMRRLLRVLAPKARAQASYLPSWPAENLLFIVTNDYEQFSFVHFEGMEAARAKIRSFGWSPSEVGVRTLCEHNLPALQWPSNPEDRHGWLSQWSSAFDVEKVTDLFFKDFRDLFESRKEALEQKIKNAAERHAFVQRLLNRLLFLSFLQKKRWLKAPNMPHPKATYLFGLFDQAQAQGENFYETYLYDLFFNALNRPPKANVADRKRVESRLGIVPFLNGGLFDRVDEWDDAGQLKLDNDFFQDILGRNGLLRRYNFTVTESTPLNQEVAVDPEMLGKVFETVVLTSEGAENYQAPNLRKATGSFYTPRIVVTLIVREALKSDLMAHVPGLRKENLTRLMEWDAQSGLSVDDRSKLRELVTDDQADAIILRLEELRACDPAVGSGAFALGLLHEMLNLRLLCENITRGKDPLREKLNVAFDIKKHIIEHNIYGVDLQAKAVEICKLRLWLSLIVDYELSVDPDTCTPTEFGKAIEKIPALPNLGFKIRRGDALLDLVQGQVFRLKEIVDSADMQASVNQLRKVHEQFFSAEDPDLKRGLRLQALTERTRLSRLQIEAQLKALEIRNATQVDMFAVKESKASLQAAKEEREHLEAVLGGVQATEKELKKLAGKRLSEKDDAALTQLEALRETEEITFSWELDFPEIFFESDAPVSTITGKMGWINTTKGQMELAAPVSKRGGFDIMVGNPPFVTARNEEKRKAYFERWPLTCFKNYQLVSPFFERSFGLLHSDGFLGFIVSNAFAKREFGQPLVEKFFPMIELQKVVDCSGLLFPGHGTPTCIVFGVNQKSNTKSQVRITATLPGGGDLRTMPEHSELWKSIQSNYDHVGYSDERITVEDWSVGEIAKWPWNFERTGEGTRKSIEAVPNKPLSSYIDESIGHQAISRTDDVFILPMELARRTKIEKIYLRVLGTGETIRDWAFLEYELCVFPYEKNLEPLNPKKAPNIIKYLVPFKNVLENVVMHGSVKKKETSVKWFEYSRLSRAKFKAKLSLVLPEIATHNHAVVSDDIPVFHQTVPAIKFAPETSIEYHHLIAGLMNSSTVLFWLKQVCFNKNAGEEEERDRFVYAGGKIELLPIPTSVTQKSLLSEKLTTLSRACWERGQQLPALAYKKLFEQKGEAYHGWYSSLAGYVKTSQVLETCEVWDWRDSESLLALHQISQTERERLRGEMIALQEEMDWLVYQAYGLVSSEQLSVISDQWKVEPLQLGERPFELLRDGKPIPDHFSAERKALWQRRMEVIQANEHIRRIEQPVYKRRWYRKVSDEKEFQNAFEWFLLEKAEYWLEHRTRSPKSPDFGDRHPKSGDFGVRPARPAVALDIWAKALWEDERIRAGAGAVHAVEHLDDFVKLFKSVVKEAAVPEWIPSAMPWEQVEKKFKTKVPGIARKVRGKLNVPRERFRLREDGQYVWAGEE